MKLRPYDTTQKNYLKWIENINISPDTIKLLEENIGRKFLDIGLSNDILDMTKSTRNKSKSQQVEYNVAEAIETVECWLPRAQGLWNWGDAGQRIQTCSKKMS